MNELKNKIQKIKQVNAEISILEKDLSDLEGIIENFNQFQPSSNYMYLSQTHSYYVHGHILNKILKPELIKALALEEKQKILKQMQTLINSLGREQQ